jgi:hypothetical protein
VFHGLKTGFFCYSLKLNCICYLNRLFTFDYSLWNGGRHTFLRAKTNFNYCLRFDKGMVHVVVVVILSIIIVLGFERSGWCCCYIVYHYCLKFDRGLVHVVVVILSIITV